MKGKKTERDIEDMERHENKYYNMHNNNNNNIYKGKEGHNDNKYIHIGYKRERQDGKTRRAVAGMTPLAIGKPCPSPPTRRYDGS